MHILKLCIPLLLCVIALPVTIHAVEPDKQFTPFETEHVKVKTPGLFTNSNKFIIEFNRLGTNDWFFPVPGAKVISDYGKAGGRPSHTGIDIKTKANDTIYAAFRGTVRMAKPYSGYGNLVVIRHVNGLETVYSHNSKNLVKVGDMVRAGDPIGLMGRTGRATTDHLHFEVRINGEHINPHIIFNMKEQQLKKRCLECTKHASFIDVKPIDPIKPVAETSKPATAATKPVALSTKTQK